ncbi:MAG: hypothetical protein Q7T55_11570 [Solirubrobacteraceae bacterium]|nr:hypothetical protein [Solirubrobacteraceae bacterium]
MLDLRLRRPLSALLAASTLLLVAGCGGDDENASGGSGTSAVVPLETPAPSATVGAENPIASAAEKAKRAKKAEKGDPKRLGEREGDPALPASRGDDLEPATADDRLRLSGSGTDGTWRIAATLDDTTFCVTAATPGATDPTPMCSDPTTSALTLSTSDGGAQVTVSPIRETARGEETKLLVWGIAERAVPRIKVRYGKETRTAKVSDGSLALKVDPQTAKALGAEADLKTTVSVRTFAASFDLGSGNPPTNVAASPATPNGKPVTLTLQ